MNLKQLSLQLDLPYVEAVSPLTDPLFYEKVSLAFLRTHRLVPIEETRERIVMALADPNKLDLLDHLAPVVNKAVQAVLCEPRLIDAAFRELEKQAVSTSEKMMENLKEEGFVFSANGVTSAQNVLDPTVSGAVVKLVNRLLVEASQARATDIHFQASDKELSVRFRIDGMLYEQKRLPYEMLEAVVSRIKIMSGLDIAEKRLPQDGRTTIQLGEQQIDIRVSVVPSTFGERVVLRLLDKTNLKLHFKELGFSAGLVRQFQAAIALPHGILLVTGPTGSGKTTTLYTALTSLEGGTKNIMTVEDPIEYRFNGISQMQVKPEIGLTFAKGLRSLLRQDPDVLMVGEIRDRETAEVAVQAALTGHLVLATLHTNDAVSALTRLFDIGVEPYLIASTVRGVLAQRLVRLICVACSGKGCATCWQSGYCGRTAIYEYLEMKENVKQAVQQRESESELKNLALKNGMLPLRDDGMAKVEQGLTTKEEVLRVTT